MKKIDLTKGSYALVDDEDYDFLMQWKWYCWEVYGKRREYAPKYAVRTKYIDGRKVEERMHRLLMGHPVDMCVDHIDGNGLNNQRANLRICTRSQNLMNRGSTRHSSSKYCGVYYSKSKNRWVYKIVADKKILQLGHFATEIEAALAYNEAAKIHHGEFARLNIIKPPR